MKFTFENLGPIEKAELELGDLTLIAGRNNTGKTYVAHALYGFLKKIPEMIMAGDASTIFLERHFKEVASLTIDELVEKLLKHGKHEWPLDDNEFAKTQKVLVKTIGEDFSSRFIFEVISVQKNRSTPVSLELELNDYGFPDRLTNSFAARRKMLFEYDGVTMTLSLIGDSTIDNPTKGDLFVERQVIRNSLMLTYSAIMTWQLNDNRVRPFILPSSRHSAPLFYKEVDYVNNQAVRGRGRLQLSNPGEPDSNLDSGIHDFISQHYLPILDNVNFNREMPRIAERYENKPINDTSRDIETMLGGFFHSRDSQIRFISNTGKKFDIPLASASSSVWELSQLYFFLGYVLAFGDTNFLVIDEPESHLDTANQILLARLLARLVNSKIRVLITTHSDYLVKEVNNLIKLNSPFGRKEEVIGDLGYSHDHVLKPSAVKAYIAENRSLTRCEIDQYGIKMPVFDDTIDSINQISTELTARIRMGSEDEQ